MKSIWAPLDYCTGHDVLVSFPQFDQMSYRLFNDACGPLVDAILVIVITTQDSFNTLFDYIMCFLSIEANLKRKHTIKLLSAQAIFRMPSSGLRKP